MGKVSEIIRGDLVKLDNGITVKFQDVIAPPADHPHKGLKCFGEKSQKFLTDLLQEKEILLIKDRMSAPEKKNKIIRYVFLLEKEHDPTFINQYLIEKGYAKFYPEEDIKSGKYWDVLSRTQETVYKTPIGAWRACAGELFFR
jgi:endonuclease YncB( thermonuclease family)